MRDLLHGLAMRYARLRAIAAKREGVLLVRRPLRPDEQPRSYIGGLPRLPEDLDWPVSERTGLPFSFIAQIDLRDVPRPRGVFFPAEGLLWFFADFSEDQFFEDVHTRVLFDPHPGSLAREREAPPDLPTLNQYEYGWSESRHPRAFVEPKTGLFLHRVDTFYDWPYGHDKSGLAGSVDYMQMIDGLRERAVRRATGTGRTHSGYWYKVKSGFGEAHWPATSIDAEYALMSLRGDYRLSTQLKSGHPCPLEVVREVGARLDDQIGALRRLGPRALAPAERATVNALIERVRRGFGRFDLARRLVPGGNLREAVRHSRRNVGDLIDRSYPHAAFEIVRTMPDAEKYVPAEMLHPYTELMVGGQMFFHQMFGHGSSSQTAPYMYEDQGYVLLLQLGGSATLGFPLSGDAAMHYWIPKADLAAGRFDRVEGTWEAG